MMKNDDIINVNTHVGFLSDRDQFIALSHSSPNEREGYVWKRVFLRGKTRRQ